MKKIRILQSLPSLGLGGNEIFVMNYYRHLNKEEFQTDFVIYNEKMDFYDEVIDSGSKVFLAPDKGKNKFLRFVYNICFVNKVIRENEYDIVHCNGCSFVNILKAALPAKWNGIKVIAHAHNVGEPKNTFIDNIARNILKYIVSKLSDFGFACSDMAGKSKFTNRFMESNKYSVIHNAIDVDKFVFDVDERNICRKKFDIGNKLLIGNVGRLTPQKNQSFLLDIFKCILDLHSESILLIIGAGVLEKELKKKAENLGISEKVMFLGAVKEPEKYYSAMDCFVMPSLFEGLGIVAIEAQAAGLLCFCSDTIPRETKITDNINYISLSESPEYWARQILNKEQENDRESCADIVRTAGYDIKSECQVLENYYRRN